MNSHRELQEKLRQLDDPTSFLESFFLMSPVGFQVFDPKGHPLLNNPAFLDIFGVAPPPEYNVMEDEVGKQLGVLDQVRKAFFEKETVKLPTAWYDAAINKHLNIQGSRRAAIETTIFPVLDAQEQVKYVIFIHNDVTEQLRTREYLEKLEAKTSRLFNSSSMGFFIAGSDGRVLECNDYFLQLTGYTREDVQGGKVSWKDMTPPEYQPLDERGVRLLQETGNCPAFPKEYIRKDGSRVPVMVGGTLLPNASEVICFAHDMTENRALEQQLRQIQKTEAIGRLAGGIAHDFNNILNVILLQSEELVNELQEDTKLGKKARMVKTVADRATRLTRQLLAFSRKQVFQLQEVDLERVLRDMEGLLGRLLGQHIRLEIGRIEGAATPPRIYADPTQLEQVIMNLVINARDAITGHGKISVLVRERELTAAEVASFKLSLPPGRYVELSVTDTGCGMDESTLARIYEPFFTTKEKGRGTGLGLPTVHGIVKQSGGDLRVVSEVDRGTTFFVYLPSSTGSGKEGEAEAAGNLTPPVSGGKELRGNGEILLLVEDEDELRDLTADFLRASGYQVIEARNGIEVLQSEKEGRFRADLVITDVLMPEITGPALCSELNRRLGRDVPVLFLSGYSDGELTRMGWNTDPERLLEKPFTRAELLKRIRRLLSATTP